MGAKTPNKNKRYELNIPSQNVESALNMLAEKTGAFLIFPYDSVQQEKSNPVLGACTLAEALTVMLMETSLSGSLTESGVIAISPSRKNNIGSGMKGSKAIKMAGDFFSKSISPACHSSDIAKEEIKQSIEEIHVTGSFLKKKSYYEVGSPIDVLSRADIEADAPTGRLVDILRFLPTNSGNSSGITPGGDGGPQEGRLGAGTVDIRGLGGGATLVLLNGQRHASFPLSLDGRVDVNSLTPGIMLDRVEVLKDGASAVYGSDAVAGVVNIVTVDEVDGVVFRADTRGTWGATHDPFDHNSATLGLMFGTSSLEKMQITAGFEYFTQDNLVFGEVKQIPVFEVRGASSFGNPGSYVVPVRDELGNITGSETVADPDCQAVIDANINRDPSFSQTATSLDSAANLCRITFPNQPILLDEQRWISRLQVKRRINESHVFKYAFSYAHSETEDIFNATTPVLDFPVVPGEHPANPFVAVDANGNQLFAQDTNADGVPDRDAEGQVILNPDGIPFNEDVLFRGRPYSATNFGVVAPKQEIDTMRLEFGVAGEFEHWAWTVDWNSSRQELLRRGPDSVFSEFQDALNGQGGANGDLYFNPFGSSLLGTTAANDPSLEESIRVELLDQHFTQSTTLDGVITGDLIELSSGPLSAAIGFQRRTERLSQDFDKLKTIEEVSFFGNGDIDFSAEETVNSAFFETAIPAAKWDIGELDLSLAGRYESKVGGDSNFNPKATVHFQSHLFTVKSSYATSFLSPSLFQTGGLTAQFANVDDPVSNTLEQVSTQIIGNPALEDQESTSRSLGLTLTPWDGLVAGFNYWDFEFENLIDASSAQSIVDADSSGPLVERNSSGVISLISRPFFNAGSISTSGIDFDIRYDFFDDFSFETHGTYVSRYDIQEEAGGEIIDGVGSDNNSNIGSAIAKWRANSRLFWTGENQTSILTARYYSSVERIRGSSVGKADAHLSFDAQYSYHFANLFNDETDVGVTLGVRNIFNNEPNIVLTTDNQFFVGTFQDPAGRILYASVNANF